MKKILIIFSLIIAAITSFSQTDAYALKNGYAVKGYDVVSYFDGKPVKGKKEHTAIFDQVKFAFSSQENLNKFNANPEKYAPQYGGWCAYAIGKSNENVSINPKTYLIENGKLYLFYNAWGVNTLKKWNKENPKELKAKADSNWHEREKKEN